MNSEENKTVALFNSLLKSALNATMPEEWKVENTAIEKTSELTKISV